MLLRFPLHAFSDSPPFSARMLRRFPSLYLPSRFQMEMRLVSIPSQFQIDSNVSGNTNNLSALGEDRHHILAGQLCD
ncbi:hypothetical protein LXL04_033750 [Taraxacum kok-saghyz]